MSTLQELLNAGLVDIGSDDSRFEKMLSASSALAAKFKEEPSLLVPATLISLDESVDENDPMFELVEELVIAEWKTLRNTHVNRPRELLRSIIIDALAVGTKGNAGASGVVWNTAASPIRHKQARLGKGGSVVEKLIKAAGELAENEAVARAGLVAVGTKKRTRKKAQPENASLSLEAAIDDDEILQDVARSAGPEYPQGQALDSPNPHWPNQPPQWSHEFTPRITAALVKAVNLGTSRLAEAVAQNIPAYLGALEKQLTDQLREVEQLQSDMSQTHESSRMRLDVLWWSQALYSPLLQVGYHDLSPPVAAVAAAVDLATIVPALAPASVCYVLGETVLRIARILDGNNARSLISYLDAIADAKTDFGDGLPSAPTNDVRLPLVALVGEAATGSRVSSDVVHSRAGVDGSLTLSPGEFAMWVFRGLQATRLVEALR